MNFYNTAQKIYTRIKTGDTFAYLIFFITLIVALLNYKWGTWLSGWDTLHPEMNLSEYLRRILYGVWQDHQGLGAVATQAHPSELPRMFIIIPLTLLLPDMLVRWVYVLGCLILGPLGMYHLLKKLFGASSNLGAFIGALFYLMNLGTLQNFYAPLEMFVTLYALQGWFYLSLIKLLENRTKKTVLVFILLTIFLTPIAHTPTLWFVNLLMTGLFLLGYALTHKRQELPKIASISALIIISILILNLYWILPTLYFTANHADKVTNAQITRLVSDEGILNNKEYADFSDISILRGYLYNWRVHRGDDLFTPIFQSWERLDYALSLNVIRYFFTIVISAGIIFAVIDRRRGFLYFLPILFASFIFLRMDGFPFGALFLFLQNQSEIFKEALRFPYTKFSLPLMLGYAVFFAYGVTRFIELIQTRFKITKIPIFIYSAFIVLLFIQFLPAFRGDLIGDINKVKIPKEYFNVFDRLNSQKDRRIATLPAHSLFGWVYHDWNLSNQASDASYQGAGFRWFLSNNAILDREFDRWYPTNEDFYNEFSYAVLSGNYDLMKFVLYKYKVDYVLLDSSIISPGAPKAVDLKPVENYLANDRDFELFTSDGFIKVYTFKPFAENSGNIQLFSDYRSIGNYSENSLVDPAYFDNESRYQTYIYDNVVPEKIYYVTNDAEIGKFLWYGTHGINEPSRLKTNTEKEISFSINSSEFPTTVKHNGSNVVFTQQFPKIKNALGETVYDQGVSYEASLSNANLNVLVGNRIIKPGGQITTDASYSQIYEISAQPYITRNLSLEIGSAEPTDCLGGEGAFGKEIGVYPGSVKLRAYDKNSCLDFDEPLIIEPNSVVTIRFKVSGSAGARGLYCLREGESEECLNDKYLNAPIKSRDFVEYEDSVVISTDKPVELNLIAETTDKNSEQEVVFRDISLEVVKIVNTVQVANVQGSQSIVLNAPQNQFPIEVSLNSSELDYKEYFPNLYDYNTVKKNCDSFNQISYNRELTREGFRYSAVDAISCDTLNTPFIDPQNAYVIEFDSIYETGKGLDICITSPELQKCIVLDRFKDLYVTVLPPYPNISTVYIGLGNQSIGYVPTINTLENVRVKKIPYEFIKSLAVSEKKAERAPEAKPIVNGTSAKITKSQYTMNVESSEFDKLIVLDQSFENGWMLIDKNDCKAPGMLKILCNSMGKHVVVNGWANGWVVDSGSYDLLVFFWPQQLQNLGFMVLFGYLIIIVLVVFAANSSVLTRLKRRYNAKNDTAESL